MRDPYEVLGVPRSANAAAIKSAYRKLAKKHHPDNNQNDPRAAEHFAEINTANEILGDEDKRKQFDRGEIGADGKPRFQGFPGGGGGGGPRGRAGPGGFESYTFRSGGAGPGQGGGAFEDILNSMFGGGQRPRPGAGGAGQFEFDTGGIGVNLDLNVAMTVSLEESVQGGEKRVRLPNGQGTQCQNSGRRGQRPADPAEGAGRDRAGPPAGRSPDHDYRCTAFVFQGRWCRPQDRPTGHAL
ncbi:DnaJ-class molecular chaperone [Bradyrhizobium sp. LB1.3]